jgi:outer membrane protein assembly factor BamD
METQWVKLVRGHIFGCLAAILMLSGCSSLQQRIDKLLGKEEGNTAQELAWEGMDAYESGKYTIAIEKFQKLKDYYPFSKYAILAELKIGDAHYQREEYEEAVFEYENFEKLHPRNEAIPYVIYQIGMCYYEQIKTPDRDQTSALKALETFQRLIKQFPQDPYALRSKENINKCVKSLAGNAYGIGIFYYKSKHFKAALQRFMSVVSEYPDVGYHKEALEYIAKCESAIAKEESQ